MSFQHNVGIVPRNRLRWGQRTLQRRIFESGNQEPRKMEFPRWKVKVSALRTTAPGTAHATTKDLRIRKPGTQENGISKMESKSLRFAKDCAGESARYNEGSSNQETRNPGRWDF